MSMICPQPARRSWRSCSSVTLHARLGEYSSCSGEKRQQRPLVDEDFCISMDGKLGF